MISTLALRGLRPCDPRIYRFPASPVSRLRFASTPEASVARLRRVRPGIGAQVASLRCPILRPVSISLRQLDCACCRNILRDRMPFR